MADSTSNATATPPEDSSQSENIRLNDDATKGEAVEVLTKDPRLLKQIAEREAKCKEKRMLKQKRLKDEADSLKEKVRLMTSTPVSIALADAAKLPMQGNQCYRKGDYIGAVVHYQAAIKVKESPFYWDNLAAAHLKLKQCSSILSCFQHIYAF